MLIRNVDWFWCLMEALVQFQLTVESTVCTVRSRTVLHVIESVRLWGQVAVIGHTLLHLSVKISGMNQPPNPLSL